MTKRLFLTLGVLVGFLLGEVLRRQKMERLQILEAAQARRQATNAHFEREWQKELAAMPFDERMDYALWEASMELDNWQPEEDDDGQT